jgi:hypothetical protein
MLDISKIAKVYSGKRGTCMCGCAGKYSYTAEGAVTDSPGYDVSDSVNERSVRIIARKVLGNPSAVNEGNFVYVEDGNRIRVVYFKEQA